MIKKIANSEYYIDTWYDRHCRSYVTQLKDSNGFQIGDANYDGTKESRDWSVDQFLKLAKIEN
jgi:hypothetical protein